MKLLIIISLIIAAIVALGSGLTAGIAAFLYALIALLVSYLGLIPFIGPVIYCAIMAFGVNPFVASFVPLGAWAEFIFWIYCALAIIYCIITSIATLAILSE